VTIKVFDRTIDALAKSMDLRQEKMNVISSNIANAETPGYQSKAIDFEAALQRSLELDDAPMDRTDGGHFGSGSPIHEVTADIYNDPNNVVREDGNSVNRDAEMVKLAETQIMYTAATDLVKKKIGLLRYSINEGGH
jgi:flagellar basal-body rod protein FlgB